MFTKREREQEECKVTIEHMGFGIRKTTVEITTDKEEVAKNLNTVCKMLRDIDKKQTVEGVRNILDMIGGFIICCRNNDILQDRTCQALLDAAASVGANHIEKVGTPEQQLNFIMKRSAGKRG